tara:strand:+ start:600 stop:2933 length:2334 start_codon:yes stop_codon:yes gene_type:complete
LIFIFEFCFCQSKWIKTFGADELDGANHVLPLADGYLITGFTSSFGNGGNDLWVIRTDKNRKKVWDKFYGGMHMETGFKSMPTRDGGFIILAQTHSYGAGSGDIWVLKISDSGTVLWDKTYGNEGFDIGNDICLSNDNGYMIVGTTNSKKTNSLDAYVIKIDSIGNVLWDQVYGGLSVDGINSISKINDEYGYMLFGHTKSYMLDESRKKKKGIFGRMLDSIFKKEASSESWLINIDEYGDRNWHTTYGGKKEDVGKEINSFSDGSFLLSNETQSFGKGGKDIWLIKIDSNGKIIWESTVGGKTDEYAGSTKLKSDKEIFISGHKLMKNKISFRSLLFLKSNNKNNINAFIVKLNYKGKVVWQRDNFEDEKSSVPFITVLGKSILIAGQKSTIYNGNGDAWIALLNKDGEKVWEDSFGGRGADGGNDVLGTSDGGYISVGYTNAYGSGKNDVWIIKTDFNGEKQWSRVYGGKLDDYGWGVTESDDGGYVIAGETFSFGSGQSDIYLLKIDSNGNMKWNTTFGGLAEDVAYSVVNSNDGGFIVAAQTKSYGKGGSDGMIVKFDSKGIKQWNRLFGGKGLDYLKSITVDSLKGYILAGGSRSFNDGDNQGWVLSVNNDGYLRWEKTYGDVGEDGFNMITRTKDGGFVAVGSSASFFSKGMKDVIMIKLDSAGQKLWMNLYGGRENDIGNAVNECKDGGFIIAGETTSYGKGKSDILLIKTDQLGIEKWKTTVGSVGVDIGNSVQELTKGGYIISGTSTISNLSFDSILIKTDKKGKVSK